MFSKQAFLGNSGLDSNRYISPVWNNIIGFAGLTVSIFVAPTWRILPGIVNGDRITPIYKPWSSAHL